MTEPTQAQIDRLLRLLEAATIERCAQVADDMAQWCDEDVGAAIRALAKENP